MDEAKFPLREHLHESIPIKFHTTEEFFLWQIPVVGMKGKAMRRESMSTYNYFWAHATTEGGLVGILRNLQARKSASTPEEPSWGFFCKACEPSVDGLKHIVCNRGADAKNRAGIVVQGTVSIDAMHKKLACGGTAQEQKACEKYGVSHMVSAKRWCVREDLAQITALWIVQEK